jgi:7-keto-8-aminopelargonate synthetase-like enzyme
METRVLEKRQGCRGVVNGQEVVIFSSNDYLGFSSHSDVIEAAMKAAKRYGIGTGGAPGTTGTTDLHQRLARKIAEFKSRDQAILFPSGYQANIAIHHSVSSAETVFYLDKRHHPSALDGARLGGKSKIVRFDHGDLEYLENGLKSDGSKTAVVSLPSVFTVDGDIAPLDRIAELKNKYGFVLILDEAHATGCIGKTGHGLEEHFGLYGLADFIMGSFSKALGSQGGFIAYDRGSEKYLKSRFRQFDYSTSLSTVSVAATLRALEVFQADEAIYKSLLNAKSLIIEKCREKGIKLIAHESMILLIPCSNPETVLSLLLDDGYFVVSVKADFENNKQNCLRITPMSLHTESDIAGLIDSLGRNITQQEGS